MNVLTQGSASVANNLSTITNVSTLPSQAQPSTSSAPYQQPILPNMANLSLNSAQADSANVQPQQISPQAPSYASLFAPPAQSFKPAEPNVTHQAEQQPLLQPSQPVPQPLQMPTLFNPQQMVQPQVQVPANYMPPNSLQSNFAAPPLFMPNLQLYSLPQSSDNLTKPSDQPQNPASYFQPPPMFNFPMNPNTSQNQMVQSLVQQTISNHFQQQQQQNNLLSSFDHSPGSHGHGSGGDHGHSHDHGDHGHSHGAHGHSHEH